jgi:H+/Cl- antiporter ClcA
METGKALVALERRTMSPFFEGILSGMFIGVFIGIFGIALMQASRKNWIRETSEESERLRLRLGESISH